MSKSHVAPLKTISIPRLELQAAVLAVRLAKTVKEEHEFEITRRVFWSDSKVVLFCIHKNPREFKVYVANRLNEILDNSKTTKWRWISTGKNSADDNTRAAPDALKKGSRWFLGPSFLRNSEHLWPINEFFVHDGPSIDDKLVEFKQNQIVTYIFVKNSVIDFSRYSSWNRLISVDARVYEAINIKRKTRQRYVKTRLRVIEFCLKNSQQFSFEEEIVALKSLSPIPRKSRILTLNPYINSNNLLRLEGRFKNISKKGFSNNPIILDAKEFITKLLIRCHHEKFYHGSNKSVLNEIRQQYWVVGLRQRLRSLVSKCVICKLHRAKPANPKMAVLPPARLGHRLRPFTHCGLDYFGPLQVKIGRRREKCYGALFTCLLTRAIHIELAHNLSSDSAIMALKRFIARRGSPPIVYCDNGTNFKGMSKELKEAIKEYNSDNTVTKFATTKNIDWRFNPSSASHMGGAWERLIRSLKTAMSVVLKEQAPKEEVLLTLLLEIEHCVNSRPLTHVSIDSRDQEALTPYHFLQDASSGEIRFGRCNAEVLCSRKHWRISQYFADCFWRRWLREYLPTLISREKWFKEETPLRVGDLVLILDENLERNQWRKGAITRVFPGMDGQVRVAEVRTASGSHVRLTRKLICFLNVQNS